MGCRIWYHNSGNSQNHITQFLGGKTMNALDYIYYLVKYIVTKFEPDSNDDFENIEDIFGQIVNP